MSHSVSKRLQRCIEGIETRVKPSEPAGWIWDIELEECLSLVEALELDTSAHGFIAGLTWALSVISDAEVFGGGGLMTKGDVARIIQRKLHTAEDELAGNETAY